MCGCRGNRNVAQNNTLSGNVRPSQPQVYTSNTYRAAINAQPSWFQRQGNTLVRTR